MRIENFLSSDAFTIVNKKLAKLLWIWKAIYLQELISQRKRFKQDEFFFTQNNMAEELGINYKTQQRYLKELVNHWLISVDRKWLPAKNYYKINDEIIYKLLIWETSMDKVSTQYGTECPDYSYNSKNDTKKSSLKEDSDTVTLSIDDDVDAFVKNLPTVPEKKEKNSAKKERKDITELIELLKATCRECWVVYDKDQERMFAKHILDYEWFGETWLNLGLDRYQFAVAVLKESIDSNYWKWPCTWPKKIYQEYWEIYNKFIAKHRKTAPVVLDDL